MADICTNISEKKPKIVYLSLGCGIQLRKSSTSVISVFLPMKKCLLRNADTFSPHYVTDQRSLAFWAGWGGQLIDCSTYVGQNFVLIYITDRLHFDFRKSRTLYSPKTFNLVQYLILEAKEESNQAIFFSGDISILLAFFFSLIFFTIFELNILYFIE